MNHTEHYRLNQWAPEDRILREDFNRDNSNIESGFLALKQGAEEEVQNRTAAVAAAKEEASQALSAAVSQINSAKADRTELETLKTQQEVFAFVKLRTITVDQEVNQVDVDMSSLHLEDYAYWLVEPRVKISGASRYMLRINGKAGERDYNGSSNYMGMLYANGNKNVSSFRLYSLGDVIQGQYLSIDNTSVYQNMWYMATSAATVSQLTTLNFIAEKSGLLQTGSKFHIYGVRA